MDRTGVVLDEMNKAPLIRSCLAGFYLSAIFIAGSFQLRADQIEMQNGDRYVGTVQSLNATTLVLHSEVLGDLTLPRSKVAQINLRPVASAHESMLPTSSTNIVTRPMAAAAPISNSKASVAVRTNVEDLPAGFKLLAANSGLVEKVTGPLLADAGPEAKAKFNELFGGLMSGKMSVEDIRNEARSAVAQLKSLKKEVGDDTGVMDGYLSILEKFLGESPGGTVTNSTAGKTP
jgi:hypothetical protein